MSKDFTPENKYEELIKKGSKNAYLDYNERKNRADLKLQDIQAVKAALEAYSSVEDHESIAKTELTKANHYNSMEDVEVHQDIFDFWNYQQASMAEPKSEIESGTREYMSAYREYLQVLDSIESNDRSTLKPSNDMDYSEAEAIRNLSIAKDGVAKAKLEHKSAKQALSEAKKRAVYVFDNEVDIGASLFGMLIGADNKSLEANRSANKTVKDAKRRVKTSKEAIATAKHGIVTAQRNLEIIRDNRRALEDRKAELDVRKYSASVKMAEALEKIENGKRKVAIIAIGGQNGKNTVESSIRTFDQQYALIERYRAIQNIKKDSKKYEAVKKALKDDPLLEQLENLPDENSAKFKVTLNGPLQIVGKEKDITAIEEKLSQLLGKQFDINNLKTEKTNLEVEQKDIDNKINNLNAKIEGLNNKKESMEIQPEETPDTVQEKMDSITDKSSEEYKILEAKKAHLLIQSQIESAETNLKEKISEATGANYPLEKLQACLIQQQLVDRMKQDLQNDTYSTYVNSINQEISTSQQELHKAEARLNKIKEAQRLVEKIEASKDKEEAIQNLDEITKQLMDTSNPEVSQIYLNALQQQQKLTRDTIEKKSGITLRNEPDINHDEPDTPSQGLPGNSDEGR